MTEQCEHVYVSEMVSWISGNPRRCMKCCDIHPNDKDWKAYE